MSHPAVCDGKAPPTSPPFEIHADKRAARDADATDRHRAAARDDSSAHALVEQTRGASSSGLDAGLGLSWWLHEQRLRAGWEQLSMSARLDHLNDDWRAVSESWSPSAPRNEWVGSRLPWDPGD